MARSPDFAASFAVKGPASHNPNPYETQSRILLKPSLGEARSVRDRLRCGCALVCKLSLHYSGLKSPIEAHERFSLRSLRVFYDKGQGLHQKVSGPVWRLVR